MIQELEDSTGKRALLTIQVWTHRKWKRRTTLVTVSIDVLWTLDMVNRARKILAGRRAIHPVTRKPMGLVGSALATLPETLTVVRCILPE